MNFINFIFVFLFICFSSLTVSARDVYVKGHYRNNGTYVSPHYRTAPDRSLTNNYSTRGNINPYTGNIGTVNPYGSRNAFGSLNSNFGGSRSLGSYRY
jgi:hypothetical protein